MDNVRPAGFGILNRNPHAAESPAYSQIWENVCLSHSCRRHAQYDKSQNPQCVQSAGQGGAELAATKREETTTRQDREAGSLKDHITFLELPR